MWQSMRVGKPVYMPTAHSIAAGLAPPYAGDSSYRLCRQYVDDIILVPDSLIARAVTQLYNQGFVVEPSGSAGYAALSGGLIPDVAGRKVVLLFSGGNITADDMVKMFEMVRI
jgi:threonine dehydratase